MHVNTFKKLIELGNSQNNTLRFLTPLIYENGINSDNTVTEPFIGAYIKDKNTDKCDDKLLLVYNFNGESDKSVDKVNNTLIKSKHFEDIYTKSDNRTVYIFDIPENKQPILKLFKEGKYTKFPSLYKTNVMKFWNLEEGDDMFTYILYGVDENQMDKNVTELTEEEQKNTIEKELWPVPDMELETLK